MKVLSFESRIPLGYQWGNGSLFKCPKHEKSINSFCSLSRFKCIKCRSTLFKKNK